MFTCFIRAGAQKALSIIVLLSILFSLAPGLMMTAKAQTLDPGTPTVVPQVNQTEDITPTEVVIQPSDVAPTVEASSTATQVPSMQTPVQPTDTPAVKITTQPASPTQQSMESGWRISTDPDSGKVRFMGSDSTNPIFSSAGMGGVSAQASDVAAAFLSAFGSRFGIQDPAQDLSIMRTNSGLNGDISTRYQQLYKGVPVLGGELIVQTDPKMNVISANGRISNNLSVDIKPAIAPNSARQAALAATAAEFPDEAQDQLAASDASLWVYDSGNVDRSSQREAALVWSVVVYSIDKHPISEFVLVDAHDGSILLHFNQVDSALYRKIYDCVPGVPVVCVLWRSENQAKTYLTDIDNAYDYLGDAYNFYQGKFGRDGIDNHGMNIIALTELNMANALWDGIDKFFEIGRNYSVLDVLGHEYTHGVTQFTSNLVYLNQSGAINESISDVFGEIIDQLYGDGNNSSYKWLIGQHLPGGAIRSMKDPANFVLPSTGLKEGDPDKISSPNYYCGSSDNGGVHWDSGVNNKAAYLMADGTSGEPGGTFNGQTITGIGLDKVARIYYEAQTNLMTSTTDYPDLYDDLNQACHDLYGALSLCDNTVKKALDTVEMNKEPCYGNGYIFPATTILRTPLISDAGLGPDLVWKANPVATRYQIWVKDSKNTTVYQQWQDTSICSGADCKLTLPLILYFGANYSWAVQASNILGNGPWSAWGRIYMAAPPFDDTNPITQNQPSDGESVATLMPSYQWVEILGASDYILTVTNKTTSKTVFSLDLQANKVCTDPTYTNCGITPTNKLSPGSFSWTVQAKYGKVAGPSGGPLAFSVKTVPGQPTLIGPTGAITDSQPPFSWSYVPDASSYILKLSGASGNIQQEYSASAAGCADPGSTTCAVPSPKVLEGGAHKWSVQAKNGVGLGLVSATAMFTVNPPLDKPDLTAPVNDPVNVINTSRPVYFWKVVARATSYAITVQGATKYAKTYTAASICDATTCNVDPGVTLKAGLHTWMIKASNKAGSSVSATATFYAPIPALTPIIVGLVSPKNKAKLANADLTSLTWNSVSNASDYLVVITGKGFSYSKIFSKDIASCADPSILTCSTPDLPTLGYGTYTWNVTAIDLGVYGKQSVPYSFTLVLSAPNVQEVWGITQAKLVFSWDRQSDATRYDLLVTTTDIKPKTMYKASVTPGSVCDSATCAVTIPTFATGNYIWTITGYNPASGSGKIQNESFETYPLLDSEFNDVNDMEGWADIGLASSSVGSGKWRMVGNSNAWSYGAISSYPNTDFQANLTRYGCNSCAQGIVIHGTFVPNDATDGYLQYGYQFLITNDGYFSVWRIDNYRASWLLPWKSTTAIKKGSVQNTLRVMANHNIIYFYINSSLVWVGFDSTYPSEPLGQIGMGMYQDDSNGNILTIDRAVNYDSLELQLMPDTMNAQKSQNGIAAESSPDLNESPKGFIPK